MHILEGDLHELTGLHVKGGNDANVAALGEAWKGGAEGYDDVVMVTLGTGVGGGVISKGKIMVGATGAAGEIGHIHVKDGEEITCGCGNKGCLEQYASATGIVRLANEALAKSDEPSVLRNGEVSAKTVFDAVKAGDSLAIKVAEEFGEYLGKGLAAVAAVTNPQIFVIGGGLFSQIPEIAGIGTIITAFFMGPLIDYFNNKFAIPFLNKVKDQAE